jgi:excisionase family DNA binding protein
MVAFSARTAHKPPVRNRVLVTGQSITKNGSIGFCQSFRFTPLIPCRYHLATLARCSSASLRRCGGAALQLCDDLEGRTTALTVGEVAKILSVSKRQIYKLAELEEIPSFRVGGAVRFDPFAIAQWLRRATAPAKFPPRSVRPAQIVGRRRG